MLVFWVFVLVIRGLALAEVNANVLAPHTINEQITPYEDGIINEAEPIRVLQSDGFNFAAQARFIGTVPLKWQRLTVGNQASMVYLQPRKLCAPPRYGGNPYFNLGIYCVYNTDRRSYEAAKYAALWADPSNASVKEMAVFCLLRSRCLKEPTQGDQSPVATEIKEDELTTPQFDMNSSPMGPEIPDPPIDLLRSLDFFPSKPPLLAIGPEPEFGSRVNSRFSVMFTPNPSVYSEPTCMGNLPPWPLPAPFSLLREDGDRASTGSFTSISTLCKAMWYSGDYRGNAGFVCKQGVDENKVLVSEEYLAHPSFLWSHASGGIFVQAFCFRACTCRLNENPGYENRKQVNIPIAQGIVTANFDDNGEVTITGDDGRSRLGTSRNFEISSGSERTCRNTDPGSCGPKDWGAPCESNRQCKSSRDAPELCISKPLISQIQGAGLSPWLPRGPAICLPLFAVLLGANIATKNANVQSTRWRPLGGRKRSVPDWEDEQNNFESHIIECGCDSEDGTFSEACCEWDKYSTFNVTDLKI